MKFKIISDGTKAGTKLIDENTGEMIHLVQKITYEADANNTFPKITIELINVPVEITCKADVELYEYEPPSFQEPSLTKSFEKNVKMVSNSNDKYILTTDTKVYDTDTGEVVNAIRKIKWEADTDGSKAVIEKIKFDGKDW